ncbi:hypothetical protein D3C79_1059040 [compost metagenome]
MLIHQAEQMQFAVLSGEFPGTAEYIHAVGNAAVMPAGNGAGYNMDAKLAGQAGHQRLGGITLRIGNFG